MYAAILLSFIVIITVTTCEVTFANFASHEANIAGPYYDLSPLRGIHGGQLPKVYQIGLNQSLTYMPEESYAEFQKIIAGESGTVRANPANAAQAVQTLSSAEQGFALPRGEDPCKHIDFLLAGPRCMTYFFIGCIDTSQCYTGNCSWLYIYTYYNGNSSSIFWESKLCDGHHGSLNPIFDDADHQSCFPNFEPSPSA